MIRSITLNPEPRTWNTLLLKNNRNLLLLGRSIEDWKKLTQNELLGIDYPSVILTGHQAEFWHPGILARYYAMEALADTNQIPAMIELVVDQDTNDPLTMSLPVTGNSGIHKGVFRKIYISLKRNYSPDLSDSNLSIGFRNTVSDHELITDIKQAVSDSYYSATQQNCDIDDAVIPVEISSSLAKIRYALLAETHRSSLAQQVACANAKLRGALYTKQSKPDRHMVTVTSITSTSFWKALIQFAAADPEKLVQTYNAAVQQFPQAGISPLSRSGNSLEMPLWYINENGTRRKACHDDLTGDPTRLLPRALLTTGFVRLVLCDLMIHGMGGSTYDIITDLWLQNWLNATPAAFVSVTATLTLDLATDNVSHKQLQQAEQYARYLRFNLDRIVGNHDEITEKQNLLQHLENAPRKSQTRRDYYLQIQKLQKSWCTRYSNIVENADAAIEKLKIQLANQDVITERTWPFIFYAAHNLDELHRKIKSCFETPLNTPQMADNEIV